MIHRRVPGVWLNARLALPMLGVAAEPTERLRGLPDNTWTLVDRGGVTASLDIMAYSGGFYDPEH